MPGTKMAGFTVVTPNYLAHGLSLRESFQHHHPGHDLYICVIGRETDLPGTAPDKSHFINAIQDGRIEAMLQQYTAFEMSCAVKPFFASLLFDSIPGLEHLIYLDGDIMVFGNFRSPARAAITISPHRIKEIGFLPEPHPLSDISLNRFGVFNAGYFEVMKQEEGLRFLEWWKQLMSNLCYNQPDDHLFVDQLWLNCIPAFFENVFINRHPGYNLAYWNLIERELTGQDGQWLVNGAPLVFYHYSQYTFESPEKMTGFVNDFLSFSNFPLLQTLYDQYRVAVTRHGYPQYRSLPYPYTSNEKKNKKGFFQKLFGKK